MVRGVIVGVLVVATTFLAAATARGEERGPRFTVGGGAGVTDPLHGDFDFQATGWEVAGRGGQAKHLTIEAFASTWRHAAETRRIGLPLQGPSGAIGTVGAITQRSIYSDLRVRLQPPADILGGPCDPRRRRRGERHVLPAPIRAAARELPGAHRADLRCVIEFTQQLRPRHPRDRWARRPGRASS